MAAAEVDNTLATMMIDSALILLGRLLRLLCCTYLFISTDVYSWIYQALSVIVT